MDLTLRRARLLSGKVADIGIAGGLIASVTPASRRRSTPDDVDLGKRFIIPGLWDNHVHFTQWATSRLRPSIASARSVDDVVAAVRSTPGRGLVVLVDAKPAGWPRLPHKHDFAGIRRPVVVISSDAHSVTCNQAALERFGKWAHPTGFLREQDAWDVMNRLPSAPRAVDDAAQAAASRGVVGIVDLEFDDNVPVWRRRMRAGFDVLRVEAGFYPEHLDAVLARGERTGEVIMPLLTVGPLKIIFDGSLGTMTAWTSRPYSNGATGGPNLSQQQLTSLISRAACGGVQTTVHAIGDEAFHAVLDAFDEAGADGRIEHAQLVAERDLPRLAGRELSVQPEHAMDDRDLVARLWRWAGEDAYRLRSLADSGARLLLGSDAPVTPLDPWFAIASAVTRTREPEPGPWRGQEAVSLTAALDASTRTTLDVGQPADIVVLDADPRDAAALRTMPVAATLLAGRFTHRCPTLP